ncbi:MAG: hypothetical protein JO236_08420 [Mycobacterium sp.]|uniref:hypothetical protein n=1 Tax=Mycobacterium sp. TaxID=1785 RepID=UPI001EB19106|nr:hypothetical protein [Mycobacterium sp.]MBW0017552.1 hypothetical protein [Mycobacterium sp.]
MVRVLLAAALAACASLIPAVRSSAAAGCAPGGTPPPSGAAQRQVGDLDGDGQPDTLWVGQLRTDDGAIKRLVGVTTASGANSDVRITTASPMPLSALAVDAQQDGQHQIIVSDGRGARLYVFADCRLQTAVDSQDVPFLFDLQNLRGHGTGVGCSDLGSGPRLVGLQALETRDQWTVRRTEIDLSGTLATIGRSDTLTATSAQDPVVTSAQTISCGDLTMSQDGVQQP